MKSDKISKNRINLFDFIFYRKISRYVTLFFSKTNISPNTLTLFSLIFSMITFASFLIGNYLGFIAGIIFLQISRIFDCSDGELARLKNKATLFGFYLDIFLDRLKQVLVYGGIIIGFYFASENINILILGIFALSNILLGGFLNLIKENLKYFKNKPEFSITNKIYLGGYSTDIVLLSFSVIFGLIYEFIFIYAIFGVLLWLVPGYKIVKKWEVER